MEDHNIHENDDGFDSFVEQALKTLGDKAEKDRICIECLTDRLVVELVSGMARSGVPVSAILAMVGEGVDAVAAEVDSAEAGKSHRMH